jgi:hypothetical protein
MGVVRPNAHKLVASDEEYAEAAVSNEFNGTDPAVPPFIEAGGWIVERPADGLSDNRK